ncbi:ABC transporter substrate-binding protein [Neobacillus massiliamazoniensis]|uniref:NMT1/THI5 like domain-containing protein n=1 Tax=Neobacillus massiliamazoniensis TaxID=1499688 RepID=A0A0U1NR75_9BACI|nr:ABC transporter substrate-binding protein [Neobacillus massiliamazoniensis]CRK80242.1 NMT1/THI5 like domain-containing protein [Neobacillus massiliamazoniensis]
MNRKNIVNILASGMIITSLLAGCGVSSSSKTSANATSQGNANSNQLQTVKVAMDDPSPAMAGLVLADKLGYFKEEGIKFEPVTFASGADSMTGLTSNQVDVASGLISASIFNSVQQGLNVSIVADQGRNQPGKGFFEFVLRKDVADKVKDYSQLKGLTLAIASKGNINQLVLDKVLEKGGLTEKDITLKVVDDFNDFNIAMANKAIDGAVQIEPNISVGIKQNILVPFKDPQEYAPNEETGVIMYSPDFAKKKDLATHFMTAYLKGVRAYDNAFINGSENKDKIAKIMSEYMKTPVDQLDQMNMPLLDPNGYVDPKAIQSDEDWYVQQGTIKKPISADKVVNSEFVNAAIKTIGEYKKQ